MFRDEEVDGTIFWVEWLIINEEVAYKRMINCTSAVELRNIGGYLYKVRCKWENKISKV
jgi:hypothetical protein